MTKKKAIKIATATVIAASAFTAVAPAQSEAATSLTTQIKVAKAAIKKPFDTYIRDAQDTKPASLTQVKKDLAAAKTAKTNINNAIKKAKLTTTQRKAKYAEIAAYNKYITYADRYVKAVTSVNLKAARNALAAAVESGVQSDIEVALTDLNTKIAQFEKAVATVYGKTTRGLLTSYYVSPAKADVQAILDAVQAEVDAEKASEAAIKAYVEAPLTTLAEVAAAKELGLAATATLDAVKLADKKAAYAKQIADQDAVVKAAEEKLAAPAVESVSAINATQVKVTGVALDKLNAGQFSVEGNKVLSVVASADAKEATITFENVIKSGVEQTLKLTEKVEGAADKVSEFKFTYTLDISSVKAVTARIDEDKDAQFLKFNINGEATAADVAYLKEAGYTVEFQSTNPAVFVDAATGEINESAVAAGDKITYKVLVTKGDKTIESNLAEVTVVDESAITTAITSYDLLANTDVVVKSGKIALDDANVSIANIEGTLLDGTKEASITDATFKTSNPAVAVINSSGVITPVAPGTVTFTVTSGDAKVEVPVTIVAETREAKTVTTSTSSSKLVNNATQSVSVEVKDQYGDTFKGFDLAAFDVKNADNATIATTDNPATTDEEGKTSFTITAHATNVGSGALKINAAADKTLATINVTVAATGETASRKLELADASKDLELDIVKGSTDNAVNILWNQFNAAGFLVGPEKDFDEDGVATADTGKYTVESSDTTIATAAVNDSTGAITVTGATKAGTATIKVKEGTITRATVNVTVKNSTPTITAVKFESSEVKTADFLDLDTEVLKAENISLSADKTVSITDNGVIYIDVVNPGYNADDDITLGTITALSNVVNTTGDTVPVAIASGQLGTTAGAAFSAGDKGSVVVKVTRNGETTPVAVSTITVNIPE